MRRKAASLLLVAMMMSVAVPVHASEQADCHNSRITRRKPRG